ncbi:MAG: hypothetical protein ACI8RZ_002696 [Myxococcota bacterium]|jgi:hypothetical protein
MNTEQIAALKRTLTLIGRTRKSLPFLYTPAAEDGLPLMLVGSPRLSPLLILSVTSTARSADFVRGDIRRESGRLLLSVRDGSMGLPQLVDHLDGLLGQQVPELSIARITPSE